MSKLEQLRIKELPIMPQVASKILQLQEEHLEISFKELERIILMDPALTAKILKVANSALYSRQKEIANLQQAITLLGFKIIKSLVLLVCASNLFGKSSKSKSAEVELWRHLILTSFLSKSLALRLGKDEIQEDAFISGLLHDVGRIVILLSWGRLTGVSVLCFQMLMSVRGQNLCRIGSGQCKKMAEQCWLGNGLHLKHIPHDRSLD